MSEIKELYDNLCVSNFRDDFSSVIPSKKPTVDYSNEIIERCFVQKINSGYAYEIDSKKKKKIQNNPLYTTWVIRWKVTGPQRNITKNGVLEIQGVTEFNQASILEVKNLGFRNIESLVTDPLEFWRGY